jgi:hypothetical protein
MALAAFWYSIFQVKSEPGVGLPNVLPECCQ